MVRPLGMMVDVSCPLNGIVGNWEWAKKPVDEKPTYQDLGLSELVHNRPDWE
jgi:hypothetical protein